MSSIILFKGVSPNKGGNTHFVFASHVDYIAYLKSNYEYYSIEKKDYRIANNVCEISVTNAGFMNLATLDEITYVIDYDDYSHFFRAYHIVDFILISGFARFFLAVDKWAAGFNRGTIKHMHVSRCNRDLTTAGHNYYYDEIDNYIDYTRYVERSLIQGYNLDNMYAVVNLEYNVFSSLFGDDQISKTSLVAVSLRQIYDKVHAAKSSVDSVDIVDKVIEIIGGIFQVGSQGIQNVLSARVLNLWLIPAEDIDLTSNYLKVYSKSILLDGGTIDVDAYFVKAQRKIITLNLSTLFSGFISYFPAASVQFGTKGHGLMLMRQSYSSNVNVHFCYTGNSLQVVAVQGQNQEDITAGFEIEITTNNSISTTSMKIVRELSRTGKGIAQIAKGGATGGVGGAAAAAGMYGLSLIGQMKEKQPVSSIGSGDGAETFRANSPTLLKYPFVLYLTTSTHNEAAHAYFYGASYDCFIEQLGNIESLPQLGASASTREGFYLLVDNCEIENMQEANEEFVQNELSHGIWIKTL